MGVGEHPPPLTAPIPANTITISAVCLSTVCTHPWWLLIFARLLLGNPSSPSPSVLTTTAAPLQPSFLKLGFVSGIVCAVVSKPVDTAKEGAAMYVVCRPEDWREGSMAAAATAVRSSLLLLSMLPAMVEGKTEAFVADGCNRNGWP